MNLVKSMGVLGALTLAGAATAASVNIQLVSSLASHDPDGAGGQGNTISGLFQATVTSVAGLGASDLGGDIAVGNVFRTFCIEIGETLGNGAHAFDVNTQSVQGGASPFSPQPLVSQTAFLYTMYRAGALTTLTGIATFNDGLQSDVNALQDALWFFQNQLGVTDVDDNGSVVLSAKALAFANAANDAVSNGAYGWTGGIGNVRVLNMGGATGDYPFGANQDVLALIPLPQGVGLATAGLAILGIRRRRALWA